MNQARAERVIDGRSMEPPEPFVQTMEALDTIQPGEKVTGGIQIGRAHF